MAHYDIEYTAPAEQLPPRRNRWPLAGVMLLDLAIIAVAILAVGALVTAIFISMRAPAPTLPSGSGAAQAIRLLGADGIFILLLLQNAIFVGVPVLRVAMLRREPLAEIGFQARGLPRLILYGSGLGVVVLFTNIILNAIFYYLGGVQQNQAEQFPLFPGDYGGQALFLIAAALLAPIGEEVLFRGYIFNAIRQTFQARRWGIPLAYLVSALVFMIVHMLSATQGVLGLLVSAFAMGLLLAWGMHRTGSLIPGIIAHAINNGVVLAALLACINIPGACQGL